jgi:hypothetical protein
MLIMVLVLQHEIMDDAGGACGFKNVNLPPFSAMTSCGNQPLFKDGKGCGSCYQVSYLTLTVTCRHRHFTRFFPETACDVEFDSMDLGLLRAMQIRCLAHRACSGVPETVIITDMNYYPVSRYHFDLSGTAFGAMAKYGRNDELRHAGIIDMQFKRSAILLNVIVLGFNRPRHSTWHPDFLRHHWLLSLPRPLLYKSNLNPVLCLHFRLTNCQQNHLAHPNFTA